MAENESKPKKVTAWQYFSRQKHFSYNNSLAYHGQPYTGNEAVRGIVRQAEDLLSGPEFKD